MVDLYKTTQQFMYVPQSILRAFPHIWSMNLAKVVNALRERGTQSVHSILFINSYEFPLQMPSICG